MWGRNRGVTPESQCLHRTLRGNGGFCSTKYTGFAAEQDGLVTHHVADPSAIHHVWDRDLAPALTIDSGDTVDFAIPEIAAEQIRPGASFADCAFDFDTIYSLNGPVFVRDAAPGDVLQVDILRLELGSWGWTAILPGLGLLADDFPDGY